VVGVALPEPGDDAFPSLVEAEAKVSLGDLVTRPTTDLKSDGGHLLLVSRSREAVEDDYARVLQAQHTFFQLQPEGHAANADAREAPRPFDVPSCVQALLAVDDGGADDDAPASF
jgi:hypothetical protein